MSVAICEKAINVPRFPEQDKTRFQIDRSRERQKCKLKMYSGQEVVRGRKLQSSGYGRRLMFQRWKVRISMKSSNSRLYNYEGKEDATTAQSKKLTLNVKTLMHPSSTFSLKNGDKMSQRGQKLQMVLAKRTTMAKIAHSRKCKNVLTDLFYSMNSYRASNR